MAADRNAGIVASVNTHTDNSGTTGPHTEGWAVPDPTTIYPAECHFRIIALGDAPVEPLLLQVLQGSEITAPLTGGRNSTSGKFRTLQVSVRIKDRAELVRLDRELRAVDGVRMVL